MKNSKVFTALAALALIAALAACGGGGGGGPTGGSGGGEVTPPVVVNTPTMTITYTATSMCASGPNLTSTVSQLAANALVPSACPALPASVLAQANVVVGSGTLNISVTGLPAGFTGGTLAATKVTPSTTAFWDLIPTTTGNASATLRAGSAAVSFNTVYNGSIMMNFAGAPSASKTITFTTGADPAVSVMWPANITNLVEAGIVNGVVNQNLKVIVWTPMSPIATNVGNNADWNANLINGNVKIVKSGEMAADINGIMRNIWRAIFFNPTVNAYCITPVNAHDGLAAYFNDSRTSLACFSSPSDYVIGVDDSSTNKNGLLGKVGNLCYLTTIARGSESVACPF